MIEQLPLGIGENVDEKWISHHSASNSGPKNDLSDMTTTLNVAGKEPETREFMHANAWDLVVKTHHSWGPTFSCLTTRGVFQRQLLARWQVRCILLSLSFAELWMLILKRIECIISILLTTRVQTSRGPLASEFSLIVRWNSWLAPPPPPHVSSVPVSALYFPVVCTFFFLSETSPISTARKHAQRRTSYPKSRRASISDVGLLISWLISSLPMSTLFCFYANHLSAASLLEPTPATQEPCTKTALITKWLLEQHIG